MTQKKRVKSPESQYPQHFYTAMQLDDAAKHLQKLVGKRLKLSVKQRKETAYWQVQASLSKMVKFGPLTLPQTERIQGVLVTWHEGSRFYYTTRPHQRAIRNLLLLLYVALAITLFIINDWNALAAFSLFTVVSGLVFFPVFYDIAFGDGSDNQLARSIRQHLHGTARAFISEAQFAADDAAAASPSLQQEEA